VRESGMCHSKMRGREERKREVPTQMRVALDSNGLHSGGCGYWPESTVSIKPSSWMAGINSPSHDNNCTDL
jgi:hypothetical protein